MVIVEYFDHADAMHAVVVLEAFGLKVDGPYGRESGSGDGEAPVMVWYVGAPELRDTPTPERDEVDDYIDSKWDRIDEDRLYGMRRDHGY